MFMFWGKRAILTRRLLKAKIRREYETECEAQTTATTPTTTTTTTTTTASSIDNRSSIIDNSSQRCVNKDLTGCTCSNYSRTININTTCDCSNLKCVNSKTKTTTTATTTAKQKQIAKNLIVSDNNESVKSSSSGGGGGCLIGTASKLHQVCCGGSSNNDNDDDYDDYDEFDGRLTRCKELLKTLKENQLEMLLTSVESFGNDIGACVLVSKKLNTISNRQDNDMQMDHYKRSSHRHSLRNARHHHPLRHRHTHTTHRQRSKCRHCELRHGSSGGGDDDDNEPTTSDEFSSLNSVNKTTPINLLSCQIWRWPDLCSSMELKKLPQCESAKDSSYVCCNPYHWSRLCKPESPPPPYCLIPSDRVAAAKQEGAIQSSQMESHGNTAEPSRLPDSLTTDGEERNDGKKKEWCTLAYWELAGRVGSLYPVEASTVSVFDSLHDGDGLCLASLAQNHGSSAVVRRTRSKIGLGLMLSQEADGVWAYNRSDSPIFVNSPTLDDPESRTLLVYRVPPGFCLNIFDRTKRQSSLRLKYSDPLNSTGPIDANSVRISFAKGWGPKYSRQEVTSCPCWLEVLLAPCR